MVIDYLVALYRSMRGFKTFGCSSILFTTTVNLLNILKMPPALKTQILNTASGCPGIVSRITIFFYGF